VLESVGPHPDSQLVRRAVGGNREAARELISRLEPTVRQRVLRLLLRNPKILAQVSQEAEDLTQDTFVALFSNGGKDLLAWDPARGMKLESFVGLLAQRLVISILRRVGSHAESDNVDEAALALNTPSGSGTESQPLSAQAPTVAPPVGLAESPWERSLAPREAAMERLQPAATAAAPPEGHAARLNSGKVRVGPAPSGEYELQLQITSFEDRAEADAYVERLRQRGHRAHVEASRVPNRGLWYRVRIGPFHSKDEALAYKAEFERKENMGALLVDPRAEPPLALEWPSSSASPRVRAPGKKKRSHPSPLSSASQTPRRKSVSNISAFERWSGR
jgi:DNA-directed RNA polymerase specialized sigma24 family protein